jgi:predicted anti-sigma-YlaC factor YlaD
MRLHARLHGNRRQIAIAGLMLLMMAAALAPSAIAGAGGVLSRLCKRSVLYRWRLVEIHSR